MLLKKIYIQWLHHAYMKQGPTGLHLFYDDTITIWHNIAWKHFRNILLCDPDTNYPKYIDNPKYPIDRSLPCNWSAPLLAHLLQEHIPILISRTF